MRRDGIEWPTWGVVAAVYGGWLALVSFHAGMPSWLWIPAMAVILAWHGSVQHEALHGHPTRSRRFNAALAQPPLALWLPYEAYVATHLRHHRDEHLTDPLEDPESYYETRRDWGHHSALWRALLLANRTFLGRITIGPALCWVRFWRGEYGRIMRGPREARRVWLRHAVGLALIGGVVFGWYGVAFWAYAAACYGATALTLVRSFAEHRAVPTGSRTAMVAAGPFFSLLFLNNNLHVAHHDRPGLAWYRLPAHAAATGAAATAAAGAGYYRGYGEIARRYLLRRFDRPVHPERTT
jgi:fatty acid desaturase